MEIGEKGDFAMAMTELTLPYGKGHISARIPEERVAGWIRSRLDDYRPPAGQKELAEQAMAAPVGSPTLAQLAQGKDRVVVLCSDHTRPVPSRYLLPPMLAQIRQGNPRADIVLLVATGCHRGPSAQELADKFGPEIMEREKILVHDCDDEENMQDMGVLPSGGPLRLNKVAVQADLLAAEGFIEPHFFAGFSGGRKSVLPGVAARQTVYANHCAAFIADPCARAGCLEGNPIHRDMVWAAERAGLAFVANAVIDSQKRLIAAFAGHFDQAHRQGAVFLASLCRDQAIPADIVITSNNGYPLDQNIYQAVKGISTAELCCRPGGVIIMAAQCQDGVGGEGFYRTFAENRDAGDILRKILAVPQQETQADQWQSQIFARALTKCRVVFISDAPDQIVRDLHMTPAHSLEEALALAQQMTGNPEASVTVIPEGISSIVEG